MTDHPFYNVLPRVTVIGGGPSGIAAALWARRLDLAVVLVERDHQLGGQLTTYTLPIVDLPGISPIAADDLIKRLSGQLEEQEVTVELGCWPIDYQGSELFMADGRHWETHWVFYAPGLKVRRLGVPGEEFLSSASISEMTEWSPATVMVVGGGDRAVEGAIRLTEAGHRVTLVVRSSSLRARLSYQQELRRRGVQVWFDALVKRIEPDDAKGLRVQLQIQGQTVAQHTHWAIVRIGMEPNASPFWSQKGRLTMIGDAVLESWERSLLTAFSSGMRAVKRYVQFGD